MPLARAFCLGPLLRATRDSRGARRVSDHERLTSRPPFALDLQEIPDIDALDRERVLTVESVNVGQLLRENVAKKERGGECGGLVESQDAAALSRRGQRKGF